MRSTDERYQSSLLILWFGLSPGKIKEANYWEPVAAHSGLFRPEYLKSPLLCIDPEKVKPATLCKFAKLFGRILKVVVFEWARFYPNKIQTFLQRMKNDEGFLRFTVGLYRGLRIIYKGIHDHEALKIPMLDLQFRENLTSHLQKEKDRFERSTRVLEAREARVAHISSVLDETEDEDKTLWMDDIPRLPDWILRRKSRKRPRSVSASGSRSKKIRVGSSLEQDGSSAPANPGNPSDLVEQNEWLKYQMRTEKMLLSWRRMSSLRFLESMIPNLSQLIYCHSFYRSSWIFNQKLGSFFSDSFLSF